MYHLFKVKGVSNKVVSRENEKEFEIFLTFFCKPIAWLVKEIERKTLRGLESSGNKLSRAIGPILLGYFLWLQKARKDRVVRIKKLNKANKVVFNDDPGRKAEETFLR